MFVLLIQLAQAEELSKAACKAFTAEVKAAYPGTIWSLKDLPVKTGFTMYTAWISPLVTITTAEVKVDAASGVVGTIGSATATWWGVRPYDQLRFEEVECHDSGVILDLVGINGSKGRDTKLRLSGADTFAAFTAALADVLAVADPAAEWPDDIRRAVSTRNVVNGMTKRQAYLVVGEPAGATTREEAGKKIEVWTPRQDGGMRIGYGASVERTGYPTELRFEDGKLVGLATGSGGGVSLD